MPGYKGHLAGGLLVGGILLVLALAFGLYADDSLMLSLLVVFCLAGALFPDIDTSSVGQRLLYLALLVADIWLIAKGEFKWAAYLGAVAMIPVLSPHRGWTHELWAAIVVPLPILLVPWMFMDKTLEQCLPLALAFSAGYISHLLLDGRLK